MTPAQSMEGFKVGDDAFSPARARIAAANLQSHTQHMRTSDLKTAAIEAISQLCAGAVFADQHTPPDELVDAMAMTASLASSRSGGRLWAEMEPGEQDMWRDEARMHIAMAHCWERRRGGR